MPIYEYQCKKCGDVFEVMQKMSDPPPKRHACGGRKIERLLSQTSFRLKGTGWYVTDFRDGGKGAKGGADKGGADKGESAASSDGASSKGESSSTKSESASGKKESGGKSDSSKKGPGSKPASANA